MERRFMSLILVFISVAGFSQEKSTARIWNEALLEAIRNDFARPTVHARNLFQVSAATYDAWSLLEGETPYLIGNTVHGFVSEFDGFNPGTQDVTELKNKSISYAAYRLIKHRFQNSPDWSETEFLVDSLFTSLGHDPSFTSIDYSTGSAAALGNFIADEYIKYGFQDGANEVNDYENEYYVPVNEFLSPDSPGNPNMTDPNRWQPLGFEVFIDQSGNEIPGAVPEFLSPEWGNVNPFSLNTSASQILEKEGDNYRLFHDPGMPPLLGEENNLDSLYQWGFSMVAVWSSHLDPEIDVSLDISPKSLGNIAIEEMPTSFDAYGSFYDYVNGGDVSTGRETNPITGMPYTEQVVKLGDYARVLAEFWADGPDSETPPGHWFTILNYVNDHPDFEKKFEGEGEVLSDLEWDVKAYFMLGGTMHDVAISAWGLKGYYDYVRPISAIRYMADLGQSSDENLPSFDVNGVPLVDGLIELVDENDLLVGSQNEHLNKIKLKAWKGPDYINNPETDYAGVDWILAENWWPYQRPTFVTPPFAGYVSGHSTYSRAAAEVLTMLTGSEYFPGGVGEFVARQNEFLVFEEGPSEDVILQWATYRDASDQCSLSRIWGGIHPAFDDIPGRIIGESIGIEAFQFAKAIFDGTVTSVASKSVDGVEIFPNPVDDYVSIRGVLQGDKVEIFGLDGKLVLSFDEWNMTEKINLSTLKSGIYIVNITSKERVFTKRIFKE
ncbi:T9SS type A sorting domain-containing protein [Ekhidna sp.]|uniref:T9SS type A sorting domain-containing protein n=1 Tax=Ekhidna sp. TaxID=2608089 RepID=UPI00329901F8